MLVELPYVETRIGFRPPLNDEAFFDFCAENRTLRIERHANGEIVISPPAGAETSHRNCILNAQFGEWSKRECRGFAFSACGFFLADGAAYVCTLC